MRRPLAFLLSGLFAFAVVAAGSFATTSPVSAATTIAPTTYCSNGVDNSGGLGLICEVTVVNTITPSGGWATVTVRECHGAAGDPQAACVITTRILTAPVTGVNQCNGSINGGGGTLRCSVDVTNNFYGLSPGIIPATVNQCNGSGAGPSGDITTGCDPFPANTIGATITQCNGSANGLTLVELTCTVDATRPSVRGVRINQCNGSANGGGALVICSTNMENNAVAGTAPPAPTPQPGATARPTPPNTSTAKMADQATGAYPVFLAGVLVLFALSLLAAVTRYRGRSATR